ncbi:PAS domain-containing protein [Fibrella sp. HMF5335]|uniref:histidine kinase n=1 Tax=Fibrella rubiginis TaxID=2817060 RepID=A0A939GC54_9BACT|nr:PAS domain-containing sensor histidine kinase [Fibrella rubiginis]MBO0936342.1 PAS domain-containing protein [Fibrella rubiginis]
MEEQDFQFRQLADFMPQLVWTARPDGYVDYYNQQWYAYTGFEEGYGDQSWLPLLHPDDAQHCLDTWYNSVCTGEAYDIEYRFVDRKKPGTYRWFLGRACPIKDKSGQIVKWFGTCTDIDEQKRRAAHLEQLVVERTRQLDEANAQLTRSNEQLQQFASVASHDLQEPLRKIHTFSKLLLEQYAHGLGEEGTDLLLRMQRAVERMAELIRAILNYSRLTASPYQLAPVDLGKVVAETLADLDLIIQEKQAVIELCALPNVPGDRFQLRQLFQNLFSNALKFQPAGGRPLIRVTIQSANPQALAINSSIPVEGKEPAYWEIGVLDNGIGFDGQHRDRIFSMFERLNGRSRYAGSGIGLAICKRIVEHHRGAIAAESQPGAGAHFKIYLPALDS